MKLRKKFYKTTATILTLMFLVMLTAFFEENVVKGQGYNEAYKKTYQESSGKRYAILKMKGFNKPIMMVLTYRWDSDYNSYAPLAKFYNYENGSCRNISNIKLDGSISNVKELKLKRKGKKYVLYRKAGKNMIYYLLRTNKGKIKADCYNVSYDSYQDGRNEFSLSMKYYYTKNGKTISKSSLLKAIKTTRTVKMKK